MLFVTLGYLLAVVITTALIFKLYLLKGEKKSIHKLLNFLYLEAFLLGVGIFLTLEVQKEYKDMAELIFVLFVVNMVACVMIVVFYSKIKSGADNLFKKDKNNSELNQNNDNKE